MDIDPTIRHTFWNTIIGGGIGYFSLTIVNETQVQKYTTLKNNKKKKQYLQFIYHQ